MKSGASWVSCIGCTRGRSVSQNPLSDGTLPLDRIDPRMAPLASIQELRWIGAINGPDGPVRYGSHSIAA
jgi:hypothetical protein